VAIKKQDSCYNPLLKKIRQSKCYPLQFCPLPDPYTAPCEISIVGSSAAGHLVLSCSRAVLEILKTIVANYEEIQVQNLLKFIVSLRDSRCYH